MRLKRGFWIALSALPLAFAVMVAGSVWAEYRQLSLNRELLSAIEHHHAKQALSLLRAGSDANAIRTEGPAPTIWQFLNENYFHKRKGSGPRGESALDMAVIKDEPDVVQAHLSHGARGVNDTVSTSETASYQPTSPLLFVAVGNASPTIVRTLLEHGANYRDTTYPYAVLDELNGCYNSYLVSADGKQQPRRPISQIHEVVQAFYDIGVDLHRPLAGEDYLLSEAIYCRDKPTIELILSGAVSRNEAQSCLEAAVGENDLALVKRLLKLGATIRPANTRFEPPMLHARSVAMVRFLMSQGEPVDDQLKRSREAGLTCLQNALESDNWRLARFLLSKGADPNKGNVHNYPSVCSAVTCSDRQMLRMLLDHGAKINANFGGVRTPLSYLLSSDRAVKYVRMLLGYGANPNMRNVEDGLTPLMQAVDRDGDVLLIQTLLDHGANANRTDFSGHTALDFASNPDAIKLLMKHGARHGKTGTKIAD